MLKKVSSDKINGTKNALFFLSRAPIDHSFTFNLRFLYELVSLKLCVNFHEFSIFVRLFLFNKMHEFFDFKTS